MSKEAISVTLNTDNLLWLRGRAKASARRSVSETLDRLIAEARTGGRMLEAGGRSVVGTIDIGASDPGLDSADAAVRALFEASALQPLREHETTLPSGGARATSRKAGPRRG